MRIVFLYSELMPNVIIVLKALVKSYLAEIHVVYWDHKKKTPYMVDTIEGVTFYEKSKYGFREIKNLLADINPDAIYVVGWMDYTYLGIIAIYRRKRVPIIVGFDDWWMGTLRQSMARLFSPILTKVFFSHAWVSGPRQYEYAKRLGFNDRSILTNLLTCDSDLFDQAYKALPIKLNDYPKIFLYVGRFSPEKGVDLLAAAFKKYRTAFKGTWNLICVGNGPLLSVLAGHPNIEVREFTSQSDLVKLMECSGIFILASLRDFSPLVVHEAACAGLPMILSSNVGNIPLFLINNYNGAVFDSGSVDDLALAMYRMSIMPTEDLILMGKRGHGLSRRVNPEIAAASFVADILKL